MGSLIDEVLKNNVSGVRAALEQGINPNERDTTGRTPLIHATIDNRLALAKLLLDENADVNAQDEIGYSALHYAAQNHFPEMAMLFISQGATVDSEDCHGNTPLGRATFESKGRGELISLLLKAGANPNHINKAGKSPLDLAKLISNYEVECHFK